MCEQGFVGGVPNRLAVFFSWLALVFLPHQAGAVFFLATEHAALFYPRLALFFGAKEARAAFWLAQSF